MTKPPQAPTLCCMLLSSLLEHGLLATHFNLLPCLIRTRTAYYKLNPYRAKQSNDRYQHVPRVYYYGSSHQAHPFYLEPHLLLAIRPAIADFEHVEAQE